jgi:hypothetical protein
MAGERGRGLADAMAEISYRRHRFPPVVIQHAVWLYLRFTPSYRDVEELLAERGLDVSYESVRSWVLKFGPMIARRLRAQLAANLQILERFFARHADRFDWYRPDGGCVAYPRRPSLARAADPR